MSESLLDQIEDNEEKERQAQQINGVVSGIVTNSNDPEKLGRVKVKFPWLADESETDWIRVASFMAGSGRGAFFLPDVEDEVLVAFEHGNIERPYIIGALWSKTDTPPEENADGKNNIKLFKSRSGHTITISDDSEGQTEKIEIKSNAGHQITMDDASGSEKLEIIDKTGSNKITIDSNSNAINIESSMELTIKATNITIEASAQLDIKGNMINVGTSESMTAIKGSMVNIN